MSSSLASTSRSFVAGTTLRTASSRLDLDWVSPEGTGDASVAGVLGAGDGLADGAAVSCEGEGLALSAEAVGGASSAIYVSDCGYARYRRKILFSSRAMLPV